MTKSHSPQLGGARLRTSLRSCTALCGLPLLGASLAMLAGAALAPFPAMALPQDGVVAAGSASITQTSAASLAIMQTSMAAVIDWQSFDIGTNESVEIFQPSATASLLNRVVGGGGASEILGQLSASGRLTLINPAGIQIGASARIDVAALIASTANISNQDFMQGRGLFNTQNQPGGRIVNAGDISVRNGGLAMFVAPGIENSGSITARLGRVVMASGELLTLDLYGDGLIQIGVSNVLMAQIINTGRISVDGGIVEITAQAGMDAVNSLINMGGVVEAREVRIIQGEVILQGSMPGIAQSLEGDPPPPDSSLPPPPTGSTEPPPPDSSLPPPPTGSTEPPPMDPNLPPPLGAEAPPRNADGSFPPPPAGANMAFPPAGANQPPRNADGSFPPPPAGANMAFPPAGANQPPRNADGSFPPPPAGASMAFPPAGANQPPRNADGSFPPPPAGANMAFPPAGANQPPRNADGSFPPPPAGANTLLPSIDGAGRPFPNDKMALPPLNGENILPPPNGLTPPIANGPRPLDGRFPDFSPIDRVRNEFNGPGQNETEMFNPRGPAGPNMQNLVTVTLALTQFDNLGREGADFGRPMGEPGGPGTMDRPGPGPAGRGLLDSDQDNRPSRNAGLGEENANDRAHNDDARNDDKGSGQDDANDDANDEEKDEQDSKSQSRPETDTNNSIVEVIAPEDLGETDDADSEPNLEAGCACKG